MWSTHALLWLGTRPPWQRRDQLSARSAPSFHFVMQRPRFREFRCKHISFQKHASKMRTECQGAKRLLCAKLPDMLEGRNESLPYFKRNHLFASFPAMMSVTNACLLHRISSSGKRGRAWQPQRQQGCSSLILAPSPKAGPGAPQEEFHL
jgi:hypothetical protein